MNKEHFLTTVAELIQRDEPLALDDRLEKIEEWDSMAMMVLIAYFDANLHTTVTFEQLGKAKTMNDIVELAFGANK